MTGAQLKKWAVENGYVGVEKVTELANSLGIARNTLYGRFRDAKIDKKTMLALAQIGCERAKAEVSPRNMGVC